MEPRTADVQVFVTARVLNMRDRASTSGSVVDRLERGDELAVLEQGKTWMRVRTDRDVMDGFTEATWGPPLRRKRLTRLT